jgi:hypothetical protein
VPETSFEFALERMFAETPTMGDADFFAARVLERLDRGWTARNLLIGVMGAAGGLVGAGQLLSSGALEEAHTMALRADAFLAQHLAGVAGALTPGFSLGAETLWMSAGLVLVAAGFGVARLFREI